MDVNTFKNILIIRQSALGDVANIFPVIKIVRDAMPEAKITFLTGKATSGLIALDPCVDRVITYDRPVRPDKVLAMAFHLRSQKFDLVLDLHSSRYSRWFAWATGAKMRIGAHYRRFYTHLASFDLRKQQITDIFLQFLAPLELNDRPLVKRFPRLTDAISQADRFLTAIGLSSADYVVFNPGHSPAWGTKRWLDTHWIDLGKILVARGLEIVVTGGPDDSELAEKIADGIGQGAVSAAGKTDILCLSGLLHLSLAVVSTDSGPMHVAAMSGAHVIALFGPTHPVTSAPYGSTHKVMHHELHCSYCFKKVCPHQHECLDGIMPNEVLAALDEILTANASADSGDKVS